MTKELSPVAVMREQNNRGSGSTREGRPITIPNGIDISTESGVYTVASARTNTMSKDAHVPAASLHVEKRYWSRHKAP